MLNFFLDFTATGIGFLAIFILILAYLFFGALLGIQAGLAIACVVFITFIIFVGLPIKNYNVSDQEYITGVSQRGEFNGLTGEYSSTVTLGFAYCKAKNYEGDTCLNYLKYVKDKMKSEAEREKARDKRLEEQYNEAVERQNRALEIYKSL